MKVKKLWAVLLSAAMIMTSVTPALAGEEVFFEDSVEMPETQIPSGEAKLFPETPVPEETGIPQEPEAAPDTTGAPENSEVTPEAAGASQNPEVTPGVSEMPQVSPDAEEDVQEAEEVFTEEELAESDTFETEEDSWWTSLLEKLDELSALSKSEEGMFSAEAVLEDGKAYVKFIPEEDGRYELSAEESGKDCVITVYDTSKEQKDAQVSAVSGTYALTKDTVYCLEAQGGQEEGTVVFRADALRAELSSCTVIWNVEDQPCTGEAITPEPVLEDQGRKLQKDVDYTVSYRDNVNPGTAVVTVTGKGSYTGTLENSFKIILQTPVMSRVENKGYNQLRVFWEPVPGAASYTLYYRTASTGWKALIRNYKWTSYTHVSSKKMPLDTGTRYYYTVRATGGAQNSAFDKTGISGIPALETVKLGSLSSSAYNKQTITWTAVPGASGYKVYRKTQNGWGYLGSTTQTSYVHTSTIKYPVFAGVTNTYTVRAYRNVNGKVVNGGYSTVGLSGKTVPDSPKLVSALSAGYDAITIKWEKVPEATAYLICRMNTSTGKWTSVATVNENTTSYTHRSSAKFPIVTGTTYTYMVRAYTNLGSTWGKYNSSGIQGKAALSKPVWNGGVKDGEGLQVSWNVVNGATGYVLYRYDNKKWRRVAFTVATQYTDYNIDQNTTYQYGVRAYRQIGTGNVYSSLTTGTAVYENLTVSQQYARSVLNRIGWNLPAAFNYAASLSYYTMATVPPAGMTYTEYFGNYGFQYGRGNCYAMAAVFYHLAKELGYDVRFIRGAVPLASGGYGPHGWCEVIINGVTYVCDPDFTHETGRNGYMITYGMSGTWRYSRYGQEQ